MPQASQTRYSFLKPVIAGFVAVLFVVLGVASAHDRLHFQLHASEDHEHGACPVCAIVKGQLDSSTTVFSSVEPFATLVWHLPALVLAETESVLLDSTPTRGPPVFVS